MTEYKRFLIEKEKAGKNSFTSFSTWDVPSLIKYLTCYYRPCPHYDKSVFVLE